jgi:hypothetical protein
MNSFEERGMGTLWTYYKVVLKGTGGAVLLRSAGASRSRFFGFEVDEHGKSLYMEDGKPRLLAVDRTRIQEMTPLVLLGGRLVSTAPRASDDRPGPG